MGKGEYIADIMEDFIVSFLLVNIFHGYMTLEVERIQVKFCQFLMGPWEVIQCLLLDNFSMKYLLNKYLLTVQSL